MPDYSSLAGINVTDDELAALAEAFPYKLHWFLQQGYSPHLWQLLFHTMKTGDNITRFRHLVAGRRGGKTLSAAWEVLYYSSHPEEYWRDFHGIESSDPLWIWCLAKDFKLGRPALLTFRKVLGQAGMTNGIEYKENRTEKTFEFTNGTLIEFKSADDPQMLRGAGLHILWIDESAIMETAEAWEVVSPSLGDNSGGLICTTTPGESPKNWYWDEFFAPETRDDPAIGRVEYRSLDNPYFKRKEWEFFKKRYHPLLFKREFEASFDAMAGVELAGDWLHYYSNSDLIDENGKRIPLKTFMAVDPAISLKSNADRFAMALIGITEDNSQAYLLQLFADRIPFPEQLDMIATWHQQYRPQIIGVEAQAYQAALAQQAARLPGLPNILPIFSQGKKASRLLAMAPLFKTRRILIHKSHYDFIEEWIGYDSSVKAPKDDCLDAVEIALRVAGVLTPHVYVDDGPQWTPPPSWEDLALRDIRRDSRRDEDRPYDEHLGDFL